MRLAISGKAVCCLLLASAAALAASQQPAVIPVGLDAYRMWSQWPYQRIGLRSYMRSTYDRRGNNERADASHFLYQTAPDFNVALDVQGPGVLYFTRYNHWHGSPWHYEVDSKDHIVKESSTEDPLHPAPNSVFVPEKLFPPPLAYTWAETRGADLTWVPIAFEKSFRMAYSRTFYGTGYYIYQQWAKGTKLSNEPGTWDGKTAPARDVLDLIGRSGTDLAPTAGQEGTRQQAGRISLSGNQFTPVWEQKRGAWMIRAIEFSVPKEQALAFSRARLRVTWDGRSEPSIDAPSRPFFRRGHFV